MKIGLPWAMALVALAFGGDLAAATDMAPVPTKVLEARTVFLLTDTGETKAIDGAFKELKDWGKYKVVADKVMADLVFVLTKKETHSITISEVNVPMYDWHLQVVDSTTEELLWTESITANQAAASAGKKLIKNLRERIDEQLKQD